MESSHPKMKIFLGYFPIVQVKGDAITISLENRVHITMHINMRHNAEPGQTIPLFTEIDYDPAITTPIQ